MIYLYNAPRAGDYTWCLSNLLNSLTFVSFYFLFIFLLQAADCSNLPVTEKKNQVPFFPPAGSSWCLTSFQRIDLQPFSLSSNGLGAFLFPSKQFLVPFLHSKQQCFLPVSLSPNSSKCFLPSQLTVLRTFLPSISRFFVPFSLPINSYWCLSPFLLTVSRTFFSLKSPFLEPFLPLIYLWLPLSFQLLLQYLWSVSAFQNSAESFTKPHGSSTKTTIKKSV